MRKRLKSIFLAALIACLTLGGSYPAMAQEAGKGFASPYNSVFEGSGRITREDFCAIISKLFFEQQYPAETLAFVDADEISAENVPYIFNLHKRGFLSGVQEPGGLYMHPKAFVSRQEAYTFLGRLLGAKSASEPAFDDLEAIAGYAREYVAWYYENGYPGMPESVFAPAEFIGESEFFELLIWSVSAGQRLSAGVGTYFGTGNRGFLDGNKSTARFLMPYGITFDNEGRLVVFDTYNNSLRQAGANGIVTLAGKPGELDEYRLPKGGYRDGQASVALLSRPTGGAYNSKGELIFCDSANNAIRVLSQDKKVSTLSGKGAGYADGNVASALFNSPMALVIDSTDNIYVADTLNNCVRKIDTSGNVTTIAGNPERKGYADGNGKSALFRAPSGISISADGIVYIADTGNHRIRKIENGTVTTLSGISAGSDEDGDPLGGFADGDAKTAVFNMPMGIAVAGDLLLVSDSANNVIRAVGKNGRTVTIAGTGDPGDSGKSAFGAAFCRPMGLCYRGSTLYIADSINNKIKTISFNPGVYDAAGINY